MVQKQILSAGRHMAYYIHGEGPVVLWIHGLCESARIWQDLLPAFPGYRHIFVDLPGCGASQGWAEEAVSIDAIAGVVQEILQLEKAAPAALIGHSMGAYVGLAILDTAPGSLSGICLLHSTAAADTDEKKRNRERGIRVFRQNRDLFMREFFRNLFAEEQQNRLRDRWMQLFADSAKIPAASVTGTFKALRDRKDRVEVLQRYTGAKYYLIGKRDNVLDAGELTRQALATGSACISWAGCGHMAFYEDPQACTEGIRRFLLSAGK